MLIILYNYNVFCIVDLKLLVYHHFYVCVIVAYKFRPQ
jgi:hypothetical protein